MKGWLVTFYFAMEVFLREKRSRPMERLHNRVGVNAEALDHPDMAELVGEPEGSRRTDFTT